MKQKENNAESALDDDSVILDWTSPDRMIWAWNVFQCESWATERSPAAPGPGYGDKNLGPATATAAAGQY